MRFRELWEQNELWQSVFSDHDYLLVDSLQRLGESSELTLNAALTALLLAKSVRDDHAALSLKSEEIDRLLNEQLWTVRGEDGDLTTADNAPSFAEIMSGVRDLLAMGSEVAEELMLHSKVSISGAPLVISIENNRHISIAFRRFAHAEEVIATALIESSVTLSPTSNLEIDKFLEGISKEQLSEVGIKAIRNALERKLSIITGGPGRGKTTIVASLLIGLKQHAEKHSLTYSVALCAPTAKAAVRMREAIEQRLNVLGESISDLETYIRIDERSGSVHRVLGIRPDNTKSLRTLAHDFVIVDEVSMLEFTLLAKLLQHSANAHVVLVGDADQLASVNVGAVLRDVVDGCKGSLSCLVSELTVNYRFKEEINNFALAINGGEISTVLELLNSDSDSLEWHREPSFIVPQVLEWASDLRANAVAHRINECFRLLTKYAVLCATHKGKGSVGWWREMVLRSLPEDILGNYQRFPIGAPILITQNEQSVVLSNSKRLANGDVGFLAFENENRTGFFGPVDNQRIRLESQLGEAETAWSMTIHKSQGSEYENVIVSLPEAKSLVLSKELLYTAVTRAKSKVTIIASEAALQRCVSKKTFRVSCLVERLSARTLN
jgi:exodeoxyribonuclease V alpha subunit